MSATIVALGSAATTARCVRGSHPIDFEALEPRIQLSANIGVVGAQTAVPSVAINLSNTNTGFPNNEAEVLTAINPANPLNIVGVTDTGNSFNLFEYWTLDGGLHWNTRQIAQAFDGDNTGRFDPSLAFGADGVLFIGYIGGNSGVRIATSMDGGATLQSHPTVPFSNFANPDKELIGVGQEPNVIDPRTGKPAVTVYFACRDQNVPGVRVTGAYESDILSWSSGNGNFKGPVAIPLASGTFPQPVVGRNGQLYVSEMQGSAVYVSEDADGLANGITPGPLKFVSASGVGITKIPASPDNFIFTAPVIDVDRTTGNLYIAFVGLQNPSSPLSDANPTHVYITRCTNPDAGTPVWDTPMQVDTSAGYQFLPWLAVDQATGSVNVIFYTTNGNTSGDTKSVRPRVATTFNASLLWSSVSFANQNLTNNLSVPVGPDDYLEYIGIAALDNTLAAMWSSSHDSLTNDTDIFFASAALTSSTAMNALTINGDDVVGANDNIVIRRDPLNPNYLDAIVNGQIQFAGIFSTVNQITVDGKAGDNTITVDFSNGNPIPGGQFTLIGGTASSLNTLKVIGTASGNTFSTSGTHTLIINGGSISYTKFKALIVSGGAGNDTLNDAGVPSDLTFVGGTGNDTLNLTGGTLAFNADASPATANLTVNVGIGATALFNTAQHLAALTINGTAVMPSNVVGTPINVNTLRIGSVGLLDLGRSFLYVDNAATPFALVHQYIDAGYNRNVTTGFGDYAGLGGITSADVKANIDYKGVGYYNGALQTPGNANNIGQILGPNANSGAGTGIALTKILIRPTLTGDINGDGIVNSYDVNLFNSFGLFNMTTPLGYQVGDFNGDGVVDSKDVTIFNSAGNFNNGVYS